MKDDRPAVHQHVLPLSERLTAVGGEFSIGSEEGSPGPGDRPATQSRSPSAPPGGTVRVPFTDLAAMTREVRAEVDAAFTRVLDSGRFIGGEVVDHFEEAWATYCGTAHAVGVANGTDALQLAL